MAAVVVVLAAPGWATSLLLVPRTEAARPVCENLVEAFSAQKLTVKMAGTKSTAVACLGKPAGEQPTCFLEAAKKSRVDGIVLISSTKEGAQLSVTLELLSKVTGKPRTTQKVKAPLRTLKAKAYKPVQKLVVDMLLEDGPAPAEGGAPIAALADEGVDDDELAPLPSLGSPPTETPPMPVQSEAPAETPTEPVMPEPAALVETAAKPPVDAPRVVELMPPPSQTPVIVAPPPSKGSPAAAIAVTGVAVAAATAAAFFGGMGVAGKAQLANAPNGISPLSYREARALQSSTNTNFTIALGAGIGAGVSAGLAAYLWATR